jgi:hypothetical protein
MDGDKGDVFWVFGRAVMAAMDEVKDERVTLRMVPTREIHITFVDEPRGGDDDNELEAGREHDR